MRYNPSRTLLASAIASIILAGCGGGSGGGSKNSSSASSSNSSVAANAAPIFTSSNSASRNEGTNKDSGYMAVATDTDMDALSFIVSGGADKALFSIDATGGLLSFIEIPDYEAPTDSNKDNVYEVEISVSDGKGGKASQLISITVKNLSAQMKITRLEKSSDTEIIPGNTLVASADCDGCDSALIHYEWYVEDKSEPVSITNKYEVQAADRLKKITLKATPYASFGDNGPTESVVMVRNQIKALFNSYSHAFAALKTNGDVITWGYYNVEYAHGQNLSHIKSLSGNERVIAAVSDNGTLTMWGTRRMTATDVKKVIFGGANFALFKSNGDLELPQFDTTDANLTHVKDVVISGPFAAVLKDDGSLFTLGDTTSTKLTQVKSVVGTSDYSDTQTGLFVASTGAFAALKADGSVVAFGDISVGGDSAGKDLSHVVSVVANGKAFAALKDDGSVVTWGDSNFGGDSTGKDLTHVVKIVSNYGAFAALKENGTVVAWGDAYYGGDSQGLVFSNVKNIFKSKHGFDALTADGSVIEWGTPVAWTEYVYLDPSIRLVDIFEARGLKIGVKNDGEVIAWGDIGYGGTGVDYGVDLMPQDLVLSSTLDPEI